MQVDTDNDGLINRDEFVQHFDEALPQDEEVARVRTHDSFSLAFGLLTALLPAQEQL